MLLVLKMSSSIIFLQQRSEYKKLTYQESINWEQLFLLKKNKCINSIILQIIENNGDENMKKRYFTILIGIVLFLSFAIMIYQAILSNKSESKNLDEAKSEASKNLQNVKEETVSDECINEWEDYAQYVNEEVEETGSNVGEDDTKYLLKNENNYINVYYLDDNDDEYLYKKTDISTEYLSQEDLDDLSGGIEVVGLEELNKILEDFE